MFDILTECKKKKKNLYKIELLEKEQFDHVTVSK